MCRKSTSRPFTSAIHTSGFFSAKLGSVHRGSSGWSRASLRSRAPLRIDGALADFECGTQVRRRHVRGNRFSPHPPPLRARHLQCSAMWPKQNHLTILPRIVFMSACVNARRVCVRTFPRAPVLNPSAVMDVSSGASTTATTSYAPSVQNTSFTVAPHFFAMSLKASARFGESLILRIPWSVKLKSKM